MSQSICAILDQVLQSTSTIDYVVFDAQVSLLTGSMSRLAKLAAGRPPSANHR